MESNTKRMKSTPDFIPIKDMMYLCLSRWRWFALSLIITVSVALLYIYMTVPTYIRSTSILLKNTPKEQHVSSENLDISSFQVNTTLNDEMMSLSSPLLMEEVVKGLNLNIEYIEKSYLNHHLLYGSELPIQVCFIGSSTVEVATMKIHIVDKNEVELTDFQNYRTGMTSNKVIKAALYTSISTPIGKITIIPNPAYKGQPMYNEDIIVKKYSVANMANQILKNLTVTIKDSKSSLLDITLLDISSQRAEEILNELIAAYDSRWIKEQSERAVKSTEFIQERLKVIEKDLGGVENNISSYKSQNLIPDVEAAAGMYMNQSQSTSARLSDMNTQLSILRYVRYCLSGKLGKYQMISSTGLANGSLDGQINAYNTLLAQRNKLASNGEHHPQVLEAEQGLVSLRSTILESVDNLEAALITQINNLQENETHIVKKLASNPQQAKHLLSIERQQKVKESIYLFLLQRLEENELNKTSVLSNIKIISPVSGSNAPITPLKTKSLLVAIVIGLLLPTIIIFIREISDTMIRKRKDIENLPFPFVGEIPSLNKKKRFFGKKGKNLRLEPIVQENAHNYINEAFRIVRTNMNFLWGKKDESKVIMLSSFMSGSGKTFTSLNLSMSFAIQKKKVLIIDLDMRKATLSQLVDSPKHGVSGYLNGTTDDIKEIIVAGKLHPLLDIIPVGVIPPNPAELLLDERFEQMIEQLRSQYDIIFIDCPPMNVVADALIINKSVDLTLFVIRAGLMDKALLQDLEKMHEEHQIGRVCVMLNGTTISKHYGYHKYDYKYNYGYYGASDK